MTLQAFHNKAQNKQKILSQLQNHYNADEIIKGTYWEGGKGCAVGCTVHSDNHKCYEIDLGIPEWLARLEDYLFENLPNKKAKEFPIAFIEAIPVGFDNWTKIYHNFCVYLLTNIIKTDNNKGEKDEKVIKAVEDIITLHMKAGNGEIKSNLSAESAAWSSARSAAESAAASAAWSSASARSAAASAAASARSASASARSAAASARSAAASARSAAWSSANVKISDKLLELLEAEK